MTVEERLTSEALPGSSKGFILPLPVRSVPNSFSVTVDDTPAGSYYLLNREENIVPLENPAAAPKPAISNEQATRPDQETDPERKALLQSIVGIQIEMEQYNTEINAAQERIACWQNYKPSEETEFTPADQIALDKAMVEVMPDLLATKAKGERMLEDAQERLAIAEHNLDAFDAGLSPKSRLVAAVPYNETVSKRIEHSNSEQGFIAKDQSVLWQWEMTVRNTRGCTIEAWVEDAQPEAEDSSIKLVVGSTPKSEEVPLKEQQGGSKIYCWKMEIAPNEVKTINHKVQKLLLLQISPSTPVDIIKYALSGKGNPKNNPFKVPLSRASLALK